MKKKAQRKKIQLHRETIHRLTHDQLEKVAGGESVHPICETETCSIYRAICMIFE